MYYDTENQYIYKLTRGGDSKDNSIHVAAVLRFNCLCNVSGLSERWNGTYILCVSLQDGGICRA